MRKVILESPYAGDVERNLAYARACLLDCIRRGEAPIASHLLLTQILDDMVPDERTTGINAGLAWYQAADAGVFYTDLGWSRGMKYAATYAAALKVPVEERSLEGWTP